MTTIVVMAKECIAGRVKTRLHPALSLAEAARVAEACLRDTIDAIDGLPVTRRILCFQGRRHPALARGWEIMPQVQGELDARIAAVLDVCGAGPVLVLGMDTPQIAYADLAPALAWPRGTDAWLGPASDGGFWALGLRRADGDLVRGVPMSQADTGARQRDRLEAAGLRVGTLPTLTDIDTMDDLDAVASAMQRGHLVRLRERAA
jgi:glycosyltransferase A (GT-A) superfamily protein (DUF2064 family)